MCKIHTCNLFISKIMITLEAKDTDVINSDKDYFYKLSISTLLKLSTYIIWNIMGVTCVEGKLNLALSSRYKTKYVKRSISLAKTHEAYLCICLIYLFYSFIHLFIIFFFFLNSYSRQNSLSFPKVNAFFIWLLFSLQPRKYYDYFRINCNIQNCNCNNERQIWGCNRCR